MTDLDIDQLAQLAEAATPGPWFVAGKTSIEATHRCSNAHNCRGVAATSGMGNPAYADEWLPQEIADAAFIAAARTAVPELISHLRQPEAALAYKQGLIDDISADVESAEARVTELEAAITALADAAPFVMKRLADVGREPMTLFRAVRVDDLRALVAGDA